MLGSGVSGPCRRTVLRGIGAAAVVIGALLVSTVAPNAASAAAKPRTATRISTADNAKFGRILVAGTTVYALKPSKVPCRGACLKAWTPVLLPHGVKAPTAGVGVDASKLGSAAIKGGRQITYSGKRLYWFTHDTAAGQVQGNKRNKWGTWSAVVVAALPPVTGAPATAPATEAPTTAPPATEAPATAPPATEAPATAPPATEAPATAPPATEPPMTRPPSTTTPGGGGIAF
jgi:predicted lipoprotein with Yx(FWY)xxD motif